MKDIEDLLVESNLSSKLVLRSAYERLSESAYAKFLTILIESSADDFFDDEDVSDSEIEDLTRGLDLSQASLHTLDDADYSDYWDDFDFSQFYDVDPEDLEAILAIAKDKDLDLDSEIEDEENGLKDPKLEESVILEKLSRLGRMQLARSMKRRSSMLSRKRQLSMKKHATRDVLMSRATVAAKNKVRERFLRGRSYSTLSPNEKEQIEAKLSRLKPVIQRLSIKMLNVVKTREASRFSAGSSGEK